MRTKLKEISNKKSQKTSYISVFRLKISNSVPLHLAVKPARESGADVRDQQTAVPNSTFTVFGQVSTDTPDIYRARDFQFQAGSRF
jgi:hypothetical protein